MLFRSRPFIVIATQNPVEQEGTYLLPEAQVDRFGMKLVLTLPDPDEELDIIKIEYKTYRIVNYNKSQSDGKYVFKEFDLKHIDKETTPVSEC